MARLLMAEGWSDANVLAGVMNGICAQPAVELVAAMLEGSLSSREVVQAHLDRIGEVNPSLNALVSEVAPDQALGEAAAADDALAAGRPLGRLHGLPVVLKDVMYVKGVCCTGGYPPLRAVATVDATVVTRLRDQGAIVLGVTNVPELSRGGEANNIIYGRTNNPYDLERTPGGSSGGSAALVAAGGAPLTIGSDGGGSVRQPAHNCGIAGMKPTHGRIPRTGGVFGDALGVFSPFVCYGPLARSVRDVALALDIVSGPDGRDPYAVPAPLESYEGVDLGTLRVAFYGDDGLSPPDEAVASLVSEVAGALGSVNASVAEDRPDCLGRTLDLLWEAVFLGGDRGAGLDADLDALGDRPPASEEFAEFFRQARQLELSVSEVRSRLVDIDRYRIEMLTFMDRYDVLVSPAMPTPAKVHGHGMNEVPDFSHLMAHNLTGWPAVVVRCGTSQDGLPLGVQIAAPPWHDETALAVAAHLESVFGGWQPPPSLG
jgi:amidase